MNNFFNTDQTENMFEPFFTENKIQILYIEESTVHRLKQNTAKPSEIERSNICPIVPIP